MDIMSIWRMIYNDIDNKYPDATGDEILTIAKSEFNKIIEEVK